MAVTLTFLGGTNQVGGNAVLLEDHKMNVKVLLDFGVNISDYYRAFSRGNPATTIDDLFQERILPKENQANLHGLYKNSQEKSDLDAVLISHPHKDHYLGLNFLNRAIPVHAGVMTKQIILALAESERKAFDNDLSGIKWVEFRTGQHIQIKEMIIVPVHVDHSVPAAYGFILYTSSGPIVYTGDFRRHGPLGKMTEDFLKEIQTHAYYKTLLPSIQPATQFCDLNQYSQGPRAMICEGTKVHKGIVESERFVQDNLEYLFERNPYDFLLVKFERTDWDRFRTYSELARKNGWEFIIGERDAYFYHLLNTDPNHETMRKPNILEEKHIRIIKAGDARFKWLSDIRQQVYSAKKGSKFLEEEELSHCEGHFIFIFNSLNTKNQDLIADWSAKMRGAFISSSVDPYSETLYDNTDELSKKLLEFGIPSYKIHASGHAHSHDIIDFVEKVNPQILIPIHTKHAELFPKFFTGSDIEVVCPVSLQKMEL